MTPQIQIRTSTRFLIPFSLPFMIGLLLIALGLTAGRASADVTGPLSDNQLTNGDLGVATAFVSDTTIVNTPAGQTAGLEGVQRYIASLATRYPEATFQVTDTRAVNSMLIVDWRGTVDGTVVLPGRTLITIEDGRIIEIAFLNLNSVSPSQPAEIDPVAPPAAVYYELPYEQARPVVVEQGDAGEATVAGGQRVVVDELGNPFSPEQVPLTIEGAAPESFATDADQDPG